MVLFSNTLFKPDIYDMAKALCLERGGKPNYTNELVAQPAFDGESPLQIFERMLSGENTFLDALLKERFGIGYDEVIKEMKKRGWGTIHTKYSLLDVTRPGAWLSAIGKMVDHNNKPLMEEIHKLKDQLEKAEEEKTIAHVLIRETEERLKYQANRIEELQEKTNQQAIIITDQADQLDKKDEQIAALQQGCSNKDIELANLRAENQIPRQIERKRLAQIPQSTTPLLTKIQRIENTTPDGLSPESKRKITEYLASKGPLKKERINYVELAMFANVPNGLRKALESYTTNLRKSMRNQY
jgi:hypothetical protein